MAYNYLDEKQLRDALHESEEFMLPFHEPLAELERITRGRPGKVPQGKPKVTTGIMASIRRESPKQVIQQLPTGKVTIRKMRDLEDQANAILTDIITPNANSGGTPYEKAKHAIKDLYSDGSSWAECFFNRRGDLFHADYKRKYVKDVLFEKGKISEFDTNYMIVIDWMTKGDLKAMLWQQQEFDKKNSKDKEYRPKWNAEFLQELLNKGPIEKDDAHKSEEEKRNNTNDGYYKIAKFYQIGVGATFYTYSPLIDKVLMTCTNKDPRGIIPVHGLIGETDAANPLGEPLAAISASKVNLADFDMQMYQYGQGMAYSPAVKLWGSTSSSAIKIVPDAIIKMKGTKATDDFETVNVNNAAISNYTNNASYIVTQIYEEQGGSNNSSISAEAGAVGYSKTDSGVKAQQTRTSLSKDDLRRLYEAWQGRIWETCLNIQFAESQGKKPLEFEDQTMKRMKLESDPIMDYDKDVGKIQWSVTAGTSQADDNNAENEKLTVLIDVKSKYGAQPDEKFMLLYNQIVKNAGVDDPETLMYTDDEIETQKAKEDFIKQQEMQQLQNPQPPEAAMPGQPMAGEVLPPAQAPDPILEDREMARQQLLERGLSEEEAEQMLAMVDNGQ